VCFSARLLVTKKEMIKICFHSMGCSMHYSLILTGQNYERLTRFNLNNVNIIALEPQQKDGSATLKLDRRGHLRWYESKFPL